MPTNPAFVARPIFVQVSEVEWRYLQHVADGAGLTLPNLLRTAVGLSARGKGAPTHADRVAILTEAAYLCAQIGLDAEKYLVPPLDIPRPVGRPRKPSDAELEPSPAKVAEWEMHRQMNEAMQALGYTHLPKLPTNAEEERVYRAEGHGRR